MVCETEADPALSFYAIQHLSGLFFTYKHADIVNSVDSEKHRPVSEQSPFKVVTKSTQHISCSMN